MTTHGTRATYLAGCHCQPCTRANARWCKTYRLRASRNGGHVTVPTDEARDHITRLREHMSLSSIAAAAGTTSSHLSRIMSGKTRRIGSDLERRILNVTIGHPVGIRHVKSLGAMRRLQSLQALGWSVGALSERLDYARGNVRLLVNGRRDWITSDVDQRIRRLWDELCMTLPPAETKWDRAGITRARRTAEAKGWAPPLAWNDIDDPNEQPDLGPDRKRDTLTEFEWLLAQGESPEQALRQLGVTWDAIEHARRRQRSTAA